MLLAYKFKTAYTQELETLCKVSNNLYNQAMFIVKKELSNDKKWLRYRDLDKILKNTKNLEGSINYRLLKAQVSQQILKNMDSNWSSYFRSLKVYKKTPEIFTGKPKSPDFKKKGGLNNLIYPNQSCQIKDSFIILSKTLKIYIPEYKCKDFTDFQQIRIIPKNKYFEVEIIYNQDIENHGLNHDSYFSIDLGVNNFASCVSKYGCFLLSGRVMKSVNQYYNKETSYLKSIQTKGIELNTKNHKKRTINQNKIRRIACYRNDFIKDYLHKYSKEIIRFCIKNRIGNITVGYNQSWKNQSGLGKVNNQNFQALPFAKFLDYLKYKAELSGIKVIEQEESYTSKCDSLSFESLEHHSKYLGKRKKRGLFQSSTGKLINADINGSLNILRKVIGDSNGEIQKIINSGFLFNPVKIRTNNCLSDFYKERNIKLMFFHNMGGDFGGDGGDGGGGE
jgi:IS605 OrfB family transposase